MTEIERKALALVERLRRNELRIQEGINELCGSAADRIEAQAAEIKAILDREADTYRRHDAKVDALEAEVERLREALEPFTFREDGDDEAVSIQHPSIIVRCEVTYGDIQLARAALEARHD